MIVRQAAAPSGLALTASQRRARREQRKQDLLLASAVLRTQVAGNFHLLADQADGLGRRWSALRAWFDGPALRTGATAASALMLVVVLRRLRWWRLARWAWVGWRLWRTASPWVGPWLGSWLQRQRVPGADWRRPGR
jgi:hypothetical protein